MLSILLFSCKKENQETNLTFEDIRGVYILKTQKITKFDKSGKEVDVFNPIVDPLRKESIMIPSNGQAILRISGNQEMEYDLVTKITSPTELKNFFHKREENSSIKANYTYTCYFEPKSSIRLYQNVYENTDHKLLVNKVEYYFEK